MPRNSRLLVIMIIALFVSGCAGSSSYMKLVPEHVTSYAPEVNQSLVIFMRPSGMAYAIQCSVFDITGGENEFVGIVSAKKKVAYQTYPGEHMFMVVGESADFMKAYLEAGKTYYALVTPRMGVWKARFSLNPIHKEELTSDKFDKWVTGCKYVENTEASYDWARGNAPSIQSKKKKYIEKFDEKPDSKKAVLNAEDGL